MITTDIIISKANSLGFVQVNSLAPNFDNTLSIDVPTFNGNNLPYSQTLLKDEAVLIQVLGGLTAVPVVLVEYTNGTEETLTATDTTTYDTFKVFEYLFTPDSLLCGQISITSQTKEYISEPFEVVASVDGLLKLEWFNLDETTLNSNFEFDYSTVTAKANVNFAYIDAKFKDYKTGGEKEVYDNQEQIITTKETVQRILTLQTGNIPLYLSEKLTLAQAHDYFIVNDVQFVSTGTPAIENNLSNLVTIAMELRQQTNLGINTHDVGYSCDSNETAMINLEKLNATTDFTFSITSGYLLHSLTAIWNSGTAIQLKVGTTVGGTELANIYIGETAEDADLSEVETMVINRDYAAGANTIYCTLTGTSPDINVYGITIKNRVTI